MRRLAALIALTAIATVTLVACVGGTPPTSPCSSSHGTIRHVVEIWMENKTYGSVIGNSAAPYETSLANACATFTHFAVNGSPSEPNYIAATSGSTWGITDDGAHPLTVDNIFRQVRPDGGGVEYHDGANACDQVGTGNAAKHEPRLSYVASVDQPSLCVETQPLSAFDPNHLPTYAFVTPTLCHDTHDCSVATGDAWLKGFVPKLLAGSDYQAGTTLVEIIHDEYTPLPNVFIAPGVFAGAVATSVSHLAELRLNEELLGVGCLQGACTAPDVRATLGF